RPPPFPTLSLYTTLFRSDLLLLSEPHEDGLSPLQFENQFKTVASGPRGIIQLGRWGSIFADWERHSAFGFISSALLAHPALTSRDRKSTRLNSSHGSISY